MTCSQLSKTTRTGIVPSARANEAWESSLPSDLMSSALATVDDTSALFATGARSMKRTAPAKAERAARAVSNAKAVLPIPPGPVSVTVRCADRSSTRWASAEVLPISVVAGDGKFVRRFGGAAVGRFSPSAGAGPSSGWTVHPPSSR